MTAAFGDATGMTIESSSAGPAEDDDVPSEGEGGDLETSGAGEAQDVDDTAIPSDEGFAKACSDLLDDLEESSGRLPNRSGRAGAWYGIDEAGPTYAVLMPIIDDGAPSSDGTVAMTQVSVSSAGYEGIGVDLNNPSCAIDSASECSVGVGASPYDMSLYSGVSFFARSAGDASEISFSVNTSATLPVENGGSCITEPCVPYYEATLLLGPTWEAIELDFDRIVVPERVDPTASDGDLRNVVSLYWLSQTPTMFSIDEVCAL